jgi:TonB-linked SusC/RagA family outer membrane protein
MKKYYPKKYLYLWLMLLLVTTIPALSQQKMIQGTINDENGKPVTNALVTIKEQPGIKVFSDNDGKFSFSGETGQLLQVTTRNQRFRSLRISAEQIDLIMTDNDALIPVGYGMEVRNEERTSATGIVKADELTKSSVMNPANALYGKIPGLTVLQNGGPSWSNDPDLFIRGVETFGIGSFVNTNLLVLVDGFERPLSSLSLAEIESVTVLKDAAALAMFGMRGANGVLMAITKKAVGKGLKIGVNYDHGITNAFRLPTFLNAYDYSVSLNQARINDGMTALYSQPELNRFKDGSEPFLYPNVGWVNESLKDFGRTDNFSVSFQEQARAVRYYTVINFYNEQGLLDPVTDNQGLSNTSQIAGHKFNFRNNLEIDISKSTKFTVNLAGNLGESSRPTTANQTENDLFNAMFNTPASVFPIKTSKNKWGGTSTYTQNPVALNTAQGYTINGRRELMTDFILDQNLDKLLKGLSFKAGISYDKSFDYRDIRSQAYQYAQVTPIMDASYNVVDSVETVFGTNTTTTFTTYPVSNSTTFVPNQWRRTTFLADFKYVKEWNDNELNAILLFQGEELVKSGQFNTFRHTLVAGNMHYGKAQKYFVDLTLATNGTNLLPKGERWGFFPALSVAWKLSNEEFLKGSSLFTDLKLRASWGIVGSDQVIQNIYESPWISSGTYYFGPSNTSGGGFREGRLASSPLTFEKSNKTNIGIDATLFKMLDLNADVFYDLRSDILVETGGSISGVLGVDQPYSAVGKTKNMGTEIGLTLHRSTGDLNYHISGQFTYSKNKIIEMNEVYRPNDYLKRTGQIINQSFGLQAIGYFSNDGDIAASPKQTFTVSRPGDIKYKDQNGDNIINTFDEIPLGYSTKLPQIYYSGSLGFEYKGIGIDLLLQGAANQTVYCNTPSVFWPLRANTNISTFSADAWTPATAATATLPRLSMLENANNYRPNSVWYADASFLKLRTVEIYYNFPEQLASRLKLKQARVYLRGMNLFSIDNIDIVDPEAIGATYPTQSSYNVGIQIGF